MHYDDAYNTALGEIVSTFGLLEWQVVYTVALYNPGYVYEAEYGRITSGCMNKKLRACVSIADPADQPTLSNLSDRFGEEVERRNDVLHGKPCTSPDGYQRLTRKGSILELADLRKRIASFEALSVEFNYYYHCRWDPERPQSESATRL